MRRALGISRLAETSPSSQNRSPERHVFHRDSVLWISKDNGDPSSPLSIERLPQVAKRKISKVARLKTKKNVTQNREKEKRLESESHFPFFHDTTPTPIQDDRPRRKRYKNLNDSVILLDSPRSGPISQTARKESVDTVDLCSDSEEEQARPQKRSKVKKKTTEPSTKTSENDTPDIIVLDDDEESVNILCDSNSSKIKESAGPKSINQPSAKNKSNKTKSDKTDPSHVQVQHPGPPPGPSNNGKLDTRIVSSIPNSLNFNVSSIRPNGPSFSNQDAAVKVPNVPPLSSSPIPIISTSAGPMTSFGSSTSTALTQVNVPLPPFINKLNELCNNLSQNNLNHPKNVLIVNNSQTSSNSSNVGSNIFNPNGNVEQKGLRPIIIDGCNVAIAHGGERLFSVRGLCICVEYFLRRGHSQVLAVVPLHQRSKVSHHDRNIMESLRIDNHLVFTPSRYIENRLIASYDDRYIVQYAAAVGGVIVSRDNYRDLLAENPAWRDTILNRLLMPTWVGDMLMFPVDPLGKKGPTLDEFLCFPKK